MGNTGSNIGEGDVTLSGDISSGSSELNGTEKKRRPLPRGPQLTRTVTERQGGPQLWVVSPHHSGWLQKRGFRWRRRWVRRFVILRDRKLAYFEGQASSSDEVEKAAGERERLRIEITALARVKIVGTEKEFAFSVIPEHGAAWEFRAASLEERTVWMDTIRQAVDVSAWLRHYEIGEVLGQGAAGVVRQCTDKRDLSKKFAMKTIDLKHRADRDQVIAEVEILKSVTNLIKHRNLIEMYKVYEEVLYIMHSYTVHYTLIHCTVIHTYTVHCTLYTVHSYTHTLIHSYTHTLYTIHYTQEKRLHIVTSLCTGGELYDSIAERGRYTEKDASRVMSQIMDGIRALHRHNILHLGNYTFTTIHCTSIPIRMLYECTNTYAV
jgi:hypothetical protein